MCWEMSFSFLLLFSFSSKGDDIWVLEWSQCSYCENKKEHWYPSPIVVVRDYHQLNVVKMAIWPNHKMNFQDQGERYIRRSLLLEELLKIFRELDLNYRLLPMDINVRALPTSSERLPPSWSTVPNWVEANSCNS